MRLSILVTSALLIGSGLAFAAPQTGEETLSIDLTSLPGGSTYFLKCSREKTLTNCGLVSLWEQTNGIRGLQTSKFTFGGQGRDRDSPLLA